MCNALYIMTKTLRIYSDCWYLKSKFQIVILKLN